MSAAVYQINKSIQDLNKEKCSHLDGVITQKSSTWLRVPGWLVPPKPWYSCQQQLFKTEETSAQWNRNFYILKMCSNFAININMIIGSMMAASTTNLQQFISAPVIYCNWFCNNALSPYYIIASLDSCEWLPVALCYNHIWLLYLLYDMYYREVIGCLVVFWINSLYTFSLYLPYMWTATSTHYFLQKILLIFVNLTIHIAVYIYLFKATCSKLAI